MRGDGGISGCRRLQFLWYSEERLMAKLKRTREAIVSEERYETLRRRIVTLLKEGPLSGRDISNELRIPEKDVYEHLEHIRKTMNKGEYKLVVLPARCNKCGFVFRKRGRLKKPGKCPMCRSESVEEPVFSVESNKKTERNGSR
jgi:predicted Zn-ribbon and HTH transcriptional regulator